VSDDTVKLDEETERLLDRVKFRRDPATGEAVPRDLSELTPTEAVEILRMLRDAAEFGREATSEASKTARKLYSSVSERISEDMPDVAKLLNEETALTIAVDAAQRVQGKYEAELAKVKPLAYAGIAVAIYLVSMAAGGLVVLAVGAGARARCFLARRSLHDIAGGVLSWPADVLDGSKRNATK
jgi:hypothetical protein